jgi:hypothetical protein
MRKLVTKTEVLKVSLKELNSYEVPKWQRWKNKKNVDSLVDSLKVIGQQREIIVCELPNGRRLLTDGNHLKTSMNILEYKNCYIRLNNVESEQDAFNLFVEFNTRGRSLSTLDFIVSRSTFTSSNVYKTFLYDVLDNPKNELEAKLNSQKHKLFSIPALTTIFLGSPSEIKSGKAKLPKNYERVIGLVKYLDENYIYSKEIVELMKKHKSKKLNGGSIIPVIQTIISDTYNSLGYKQILDLIVDFSVWFEQNNPSIQFNKDNVGSAFKEYLSMNNICKI